MIKGFDYIEIPSVAFQQGFLTSQEIIYVRTTCKWLYNDLSDLQHFTACKELGFIKCNKYEKHTVQKTYQFVMIKLYNEIKNINNDIHLSTIHRVYELFDKNPHISLSEISNTLTDLFLVFIDFIISNKNICTINQFNILKFIISSVNIRILLYGLYSSNEPTCLLTNLRNWIIMFECVNQQCKSNPYECVIKKLNKAVTTLYNKAILYRHIEPVLVGVRGGHYILFKDTKIYI